nr:hypothetical protein [Lachnospiraceae bacterium]
EKEIARLRTYSNELGKKISDMMKRREELREEYAAAESKILLEERETVELERIKIRPDVEMEYAGNRMTEYRVESKRFDERDPYMDTRHTIADDEIHMRLY